jgi:hypothetical protein
MNLPRGLYARSHLATLGKHSVVTNIWMQVKLAYALHLWLFLTRLLREKC